jgi:hypothetical protein
LKDEPKIITLLSGYSLRITDGHHLSGTEHRIKETCYNTASPLPGFTFAILAPDSHIMLYFTILGQHQLFIFSHKFGGSPNVKESEKI